MGLYDEVRKLTEVHGNPGNCTISYGTAGFRGNADGLDHVFFRMGLLAVLRSKDKGGATIGVMTTASHNPEEDNGLKLIDPMGDMLEESWESLATELAHAGNDDVVKILENIIKKHKIDMSLSASVFGAKDTRPSSEKLTNAAIDGVRALGVKYQDFGLLTTPQLHYIVACKNTGQEATEEGYYKKISEAFLSALGDRKCAGEVIVDCANGVAASKVREIAKRVSEKLKIKVVNDGSEGKLNEHCGADYVKIIQKSPAGIDIQPNRRYASYDGDGDRLIYFTAKEDSSFVMLDGDRIAVLIASYFQQLLKEAGISLEVGVVQTAYANGSSTNYLTNDLKVTVACVKTGVKHLQRKAKEFDVGVYFEANGHGTVILKPDVEKRIREAEKDGKMSKSESEAVKRLIQLIDMINQVVGDAMSDMLVVEAILCCKGWSIKNWYEMYTELAYRQLKVPVKDRTVLVNADADRKVASPPDMQGRMDAIVRKYKNGRTFARPSGTEDVVRVYGESDTQENADRLAGEIRDLVREYAGEV